MQNRKIWKSIIRNHDNDKITDLLDDFKTLPIPNGAVFVTEFPGRTGPEDWLDDFRTAS